MSIENEIFHALYYIFPAYCANAAPVIFGGGRPIDLGRKFIDGKPIFGQNKTYRGFISGLLVGTIVGYVQGLISPLFNLPGGGIIRGFTLSIGALIGDLIGSFIKRRLGLKPGASLPVIDQTSFVVFALLLSLAIEPEAISPLGAILIVVLTAPIHVLVNVIAYLLRLKESPW